MDGLAVGVMAFHRCDPGLIPAWVICELSLFDGSVVLSHATGVFLWFSYLIKNQHSESSVESL